MRGTSLVERSWNLVRPPDTKSQKSHEYNEYHVAGKEVTTRGFAICPV